MLRSRSSRLHLLLLLLLPARSALLLARPGRVSRPPAHRRLCHAVCRAQEAIHQYASANTRRTSYDYDAETSAAVAPALARAAAPAPPPAAASAFGLAPPSVAPAQGPASPAGPGAVVPPRTPVAEDAGAGEEEGDPLAFANRANLAECASYMQATLKSARRAAGRPRCCRRSPRRCYAASRGGGGRRA